MRLTHRDFEACMDQPFHIHYGNGEVLDVSLTELRLWGPDAPNTDPEAVQPFAIMFQSDLREYLPQATYRISNDKLGAHDIFIVPLGPNDRGMRYEAVFS